MRLAAGLRPVSLGTYSAPPYSIAEFRGTTRRREKGKKWKEREGGKRWKISK